MNEFLNNANKVVTYLFNTYLRELPVLQTFSLVITGILLFFVIHMVQKANTIPGKRDKFIDKWGLADMSKVKVMRAWSEIVQNINSGVDGAMKKAIGDADKMLDEALKANGFYGKNIDERLNKVDEARLPNIKEIWQAHRFAERIKKDATVPMTQHEARNIIGIYRDTFKELNLIDD